MLTSEDQIWATSSTRGDSATAYTLAPIVWLKEIVDAAQEQQQFVQFAYQTTLPQGTSDVIIPYRTNYMSTWNSSVTPGTAVNFTRLTNVKGKQLTPADENYAVAVTYDTIRKGGVDWLKAAKDELTYKVGQAVDIAIATALDDATAATSTVAGAQTVYGGDATRDSDLTTGDTITTAMVAEAARKLKSKNCYYWTLGTSESLCSAAKNPWQNTAQTPFILAISPEQEEAFRTDSQFVNAAEYGGREVVANGEIGQYLGIRIVVSNNTPKYAASATGPDGTTTTVPITRCIMYVGKKASAIAYGQKPKLHVVDYPSELEQRLIIEQAYQAGIVQNDAVCWIDVADN
jgi:N4-gp56 family major capsid protein